MTVCVRGGCDGLLWVVDVDHSGIHVHVIALLDVIG
jgi:hypothetical protein